LTRFEQVQGLFQLLARCRKVLQKFYIEVKVNQKREVFVFP